MTNFYSDWRNVNSKGYTARDFFFAQVFEAMAENVNNHSLPFFNREPDAIPRELSTGKIINNMNTIALEQVASKKGYKSNLWIYGDELNRLQKEVGDLYYKKNAEPVLCLGINDFNGTHLFSQDFKVSEGGSRKNEQYLYNLDSLDEKSQQKLLKYFENANAHNADYVKHNKEAYVFNNGAGAENKELQREAMRRAMEASQSDGLNFTPVMASHYLHTLGNSLGGFPEKYLGEKERSCYEKCSQLVENVRQGKMSEKDAGRFICKSLFAGTQVQRVVTAKGFNLENAKRNEELRVAESVRETAYRKSNGFSR